MHFEQGNNPQKKLQPPKGTVWNLKPSQNAKCVMLDLTNLLIQQTKSYLHNFPGVINLFELQIVPTLSAMLATKQINSLIGLRQMKCAILIIQNLQVGINMLQNIVSEAETFAVKSRDNTLLVAPSWRSLIGFECLQLAIANAELTRIFSQTCFSNQSTPILLQILETYLRASKAIEANQSSSSDQQLQTYIGTQKIAKLIDSQQIDSELTAPTAQQIERIIIESVCTFADNFVHVFQAIGVKLGTYAGSSNRNQNFNNEDNNSESLCKQLLQISWKPLIDTMQRLIKSNIDEASCQMLLKAYQSCIGACGSANVFEGRDAFLTSLCQQCVTSPYPSMVGSKQKPTFIEYQLTQHNIQMCKTLLNIAHCLCHILDVKSWFVILETMQNIDFVIQRRGTTSETPFKQQQINFNEIRTTVMQKMQDFNILERSQNKGGAHHTRISSIIKPKIQASLTQSAIHQIQDEKSLEIQILLDSINSLFTSSLLFDEQSLAELICALAQLTVTKLQDSSGGDLQDFGLRRLIETALVNISRIDVFWKILIAHFEILLQSKDFLVRQYTIEAMQLLTVEIFQFKKQSNNYASEDVFDQGDQTIADEGKDRIQDEQWLNDSWQYTILLPFSELLKSNHTQDKILVLKCFEKIIQQCGLQVRNDGWRIIILSISKSVETEQEQVTSCGFRSLKLIVSNYISKLSNQNFRTVLNAIHLYASYKGGNINNNLIAISMFQNIADYIARQIKSEVSAFRSTWLVVFERIKSLGQDHRAEVRRANIHTLDNIIMTHGSTFMTAEEDEDEVWPFVLQDVVIGMLDQSISRFEQNQTQTTNISVGQPAQTPQFNSQKKINFEEASVVKALKKHDEQWEDTCSILSETACRSFKKYVSISQNPEQASSFWENLVLLLCRLLEDTDSGMELCKTIFKSLSDLAPICSVVISQDSINQLLLATKNLVEAEILKSQEDKNLVLRLLKSVPVLVECLRKLFEQTELFERNTDCLYQLITTLTKCSGSSDGFLGFGQPNRLLSEEKVVFDFIEALCSPTIAYFDFLFQFLVFVKNDNRSEAFIRRTLTIFFNALLKGKLCIQSENQTGLIFRVITQLCQAISDLVELRYDVEAAKILIFQAKGQPTLFYTCGLYLILIASYLINSEQFKARIWAHQYATNESKLGAPKRQVNSEMAIGETGGLLSIDDQSVLQKYPLLGADQKGSEFTEDMLFTGIDIALLKSEEMNVDVYKSQQIKDMIWDLTQSKIMPIIQFDGSRLKHTIVFQEVQKSSQDLDIQTINFIVNCLLPNSIDHIPNPNSVDFEQILIQIIDQGCQQLSNQNVSDSLSKYCLNNLFELCKQQAWPAQSQHYEIRKKIAHIATPILVNRCKITLMKFIQDEQKSGSVKLSQQRVQEVNFILRKLFDLESTDKDHLIQLMPVFAEMVLSNEQQIKEVLCKILLEISACIIKIYPERARCSSGGV